MRRVGGALAVVLLVAGCTATPTPPAPGRTSTTSVSSVGPSATTTSVSAVEPSATTTAPTVEPPASTVEPPATTTPPTCAWSPCYADPGPGAPLPGTVGEASGIAASSVDPDLYFVVDDGTDADSITAVRADGSSLGTVAVDGMAARNAEALVAGPCPAGRCLFVGDIGGNSGRDTVTIHRLTEPTLPLPASVASERWRYTYPDGSFNAEAMLIADDGSIVVITKPDGGQTPHRVYSGPAGGGELVLRTTFVPPTPARPSRSLLVGNVVTDAARSSDAVLLLTYDQVTEYRAPTTGADPTDFPAWEQRPVPTPDQWQAEGVSYRAAGGCGYVVVSEKSPVGDPEIAGVDCR